METDEESGSPSWSSSFFTQITENVARAVAAVAAAIRSPRPSVVYSSKEESGSQLQKLQHQVSRLLKGLSSPPEVKSGSYNPEILTSQKHQWANFQLQLLDHRVWEEPSKLFESMVVVGLLPNSDVQALQNLYFARKFEGSGRFRNTLGGQHQCRIEPNLKPQVLFVYPPEKQMPLKYKDLLSFCFPTGVEVGLLNCPAAARPQRSLGTNRLISSDRGPQRPLEYPKRPLGSTARWGARIQLLNGR
ncbi:DENN domain-containing protein [Perilla frutescens var. hirtella]|uniref:DENN domain-containing protein n=1 Tax=Perilla frutescens var. hirtella TaxID=608512 RepID=A0AAD4NWZ5_PERFH|nr:DENN domain-containing protein [Perilla frutescens var. hirtella]